jgi:transcriptional regulator with XRE-family HTH domain
MTGKDHQASLDAFFEQLLDRSDPHGGALDGRVRQAQVLCGRWLALRRLRLGMSLESLAERAAWPEQALLFVELGLSDQARDLPTAEPLIRQLAGQFSDDAWIAMVLAIALGRHQRPSDLILRRVAADLEVVDEQVQNVS